MEVVLTHVFKRFARDVLWGIVAGGGTLAGVTAATIWGKWRERIMADTAPPPAAHPNRVHDHRMLR